MVRVGFTMWYILWMVCHWKKMNQMETITRLLRWLILTVHYHRGYGWQRRTMTFLPTFGPTAQPPWTTRFIVRIRKTFRISDAWQQALGLVMFIDCWMSTCHVCRWIESWIEPLLPHTLLAPLLPCSLAPLLACSLARLLACLLPFCTACRRNASSTSAI